MSIRERPPKYNRKLQAARGQRWPDIFAKPEFLSPSMLQGIKKKLQIKKRCGDFPGGPVVKNQGFHRRGHRYDPWSGN